MNNKKTVETAPSLTPDEREEQHVRRMREAVEAAKSGTLVKRKPAEPSTETKTEDRREQN
jgi:hypothetical protein